MLTPDYLDTLPDDIVALYDEFQQSVINDIARRLAKKPMTPTAAWQAQRLIESWKLYEDVLQEIAALTGRSEKELARLFQKAGVKSLRFDDSIYKAAGLNPLPLNLSPAMAQTLSAGLLKTGGVMRNLTMTTANTAQQSFIAASDFVYLQVTSGAFDYNTAIRNAIKKVASDGVKVINYASGKTDLLDVATRRTILTGVGQTAGKLQEVRANEMGQDLVQVSMHGGARPSHALWQGGIYSRSGTDPDYLDFVTETGYGTVTGLQGANCRHSWYPFFKGISKDAYDNAMRDEMTNKTVMLNGKQTPLYEATQIQRSIERKIRLWKRQAYGLEAGKEDASFEFAKVKQWQSRMRAFIKATKLDRQYIREQVIR